MPMAHKPFCIKSDHLVLPGGAVLAGYLPILDGVFLPVAREAPENMEVIDRSGCWIAPGYVDTHVHGFMGHDVMDCDARGVDATSVELARRGTTSWVPTTLTQPSEQIRAACASVYEARCARGDDFMGARIEGIFLEGPFFTKKHAGAQNPEHMIDPDVGLFCEWQDAAHGLICKSSLAPEREGSPRYCATLKEMGVVAALGHSAATYEEGLAAVAAGATVFVHVFNGMDEFGHRAPGLVGLAMTTPATFAELICDGLHVAPAAIKALVAAKGWQQVAIVSDCLRCGGMPEGDYVLGDLPIRVEGGLARLVGGDGATGNIAGSTTTVAQEAKNLMDWGIVTAEQAIRMGSEIPAVSCGIDDGCGLILPGRVADLNVLSASLTVEETYLGGRLVA